MMALYLALPAMFLSALISLSVIAAKDTRLIERIGYQWGYFLLVFLLIRIQRSAILGSQYSYYLKSLNYSVKLTKITTVLLVILAGNAPLLAPSLLAFLIPNIDTLMTQFYFILFAISVLSIAVLAIKSATFLVFSLIIFPLISLLLVGTKIIDLFADIPLTQTATILNITWLSAMLLEGYFTSSLNNFYQRLSAKLHFNNPIKLAFSGKKYWHFRLIEAKQQLAANLGRLLTLVLISILVMIFQLKMHTLASIPVQLMLNYLFALVIASYHFDNEAFYKKYRYYLASLLITPTKRYFYDTLTIALPTLLMLFISILLLQFSYLIALILPLTIAITVIAIHYFTRNFFILPSILTLLLLLIFFAL